VKRLEHRGGTRGVGRSSSGRLATGGQSILVALVALLALAAVAFAAHPKDGALYTGSIGKGCQPASICRAEFRVSHDGKTMQFTGGSAFSLGCPGGGGEFFISTKKSDQAKGAFPPPLVKIHANGTFFGARTVKRNSAKITFDFTGRFTGSGKTLVFKLVSGKCSSLQFKLKTP
jgi:hypothetical protein